MRQVVIENPILNSAFAEPTRHFRFDEDGITSDVIAKRRPSSYFVPIPRARKRTSTQLALAEDWIESRIEENQTVNRIRERVDIWRRGGHRGTTATTASLLTYWADPERERKLFFCQIEALETAIYLTEVAPRFGDTWIDNDLRDSAAANNPDLYRMALKMATGSGKTVVMAMLIAWQVLNKLANPRDARFTDQILIVTPGLTIRDRLRVLLPNDPDNYYRARDIVTPEQLVQIGSARIVITNYHAFRLKERVKAAKLTKSILTQGAEASPFTESPQQMAARICRPFKRDRQIIVVNDEAHHCYRRKVDDDGPKLTGDDRKEAERNNEEARIWISGLEAINRRMGARDGSGIKVVYDLSATPFFLRGSGHAEGTLFPWVVSDFSLIDAIESGVVKVPRVPVADDAMTGESPTYRDLWTRIREHLPRKGRKTEAITGEPHLPVELEGALQSLYSNYEKHYRTWEAGAATSGSQTPPVFIVVCNNTNVSKLVFDYIAGWERTLPDGTSRPVPGKLARFSNVEDDRWTARPNTILVDSQQLESGDAMSADFKLIAAHEIEEFKAEYRIRFPDRDVEALTDEDILREVMNTVGKPGKLGERIKCVVSVSMLTEGWDANTVTHILGIRAFGTQLLCEQVVGRALRRASYAADEHGMFTPEYAEVYGVPFSFIPASGAIVNPKPGPPPTRVRALEDRIHLEQTFPRLLGYRYELSEERLEANFTPESTLALSTADLPTRVENAPIVGEASIHTLDDLKHRRKQEVAFLLAKLVLEKYFRANLPTEGQGSPPFPLPQRGEGGPGGLGGNSGAKEVRGLSDPHVQAWRFPAVFAIAKRWLAECVTYKDNTFPQLLLLVEFAHDAADKIYGAIARSESAQRRLLPILRAYDPVGSTRYVDFDTARPVYRTDPSKSHISHVVADTGTWEQKMAEALESMPEVLAYVKNQGLGFTIPYNVNNQERQYTPDFLVHIDDGHGPYNRLNLILEVSGEARKDKATKVATARTFWIPAVNNHGGFGRWAFLEITDPWDAQNTIRAAIKNLVLTPTSPLDTT